MNILTQALVKDLFIYDDGRLIRKGKIFKTKRTKDRLMTLTGTAGRGYQVVRIQNKNYYLHRIIFLYHHGYLPNQIDHIDQDKLNNRIENLRASNNTLNNVNKSRRKDNTTGYPGVYKYDKKEETWGARISIAGKSYSLGLFSSKEKAYASYLETGRQWYGEHFNVSTT